MYYIITFNCIIFLLLTLSITLQPTTWTAQSPTKLAATPKLRVLDSCWICCGLNLFILIFDAQPVTDLSQLWTLLREEAKVQSTADNFRTKSARSVVTQRI